MKVISIIDLTESLHFREIVTGFLGGKFKRYKFVEYRENPNHEEDYCLVLGAHANYDAIDRLAVRKDRIIIYNLEQFAKGYGWLSAEYERLLAGHYVIDYSKENQFYYQATGKAVAYMPVPLFDSFRDPHANKPRQAYGETYYDFIVFGMESRRRRNLVNSLNQKGFLVGYSTDLWGENRYRAIKNATAVLNLHVHDGGFLETTRLNYCIMNGFDVVSEPGRDDEMNSAYAGCVRFLKEIDSDIDLRRTLKDIKSFRMNAVEERENLMSRLGEDLVDQCFDNFFNLQNSGRANQYKKVAQKDRLFRLDSFELASPSTGLAMGDVEQMAGRLNELAESHLENRYVAAIFNKYKYYSDAGYRDAWLRLIDNFSSAVKSKSALEIFETFKALIQGDSRCVLHLVVENSHWIDESFGTAISKSIHDLSDSEFESVLAGLVLDLSNRSGAIMEVIYGSLLDECEKRGAIEALSRYALSLVNSKDNLSSVLKARIAAILYNKGDQLNAVRIAKAAVREGVVSQGVINLSNAKLAKYPDEFVNARDAYAESLKGAHTINDVYRRLSSRTDPAAFAKVHKVISHGAILNDAYHCVEAVDNFSGIVYASDDALIVDKSVLSSLKRVAIVGHYNESDILRWCVQSLKLQGFEVVILDNWSDDEHFEVAMCIANEYECLVERYPDARADHYDWSGILRRKAEIALRFQGYWVAHQDADEIRLSSSIGLTFSELISYADFLGFNAIDHIVLNVRPTIDVFHGQASPFMYFPYFEYGGNDLSMQIKTWKQGETLVDLAGTGGHSVSFMDRAVFPLRQYLFHFPIRSKVQAYRKIYHERLPRFTSEERGMGWHVHYDEFKNSGLSEVALFDKYKLLPLSDFRSLSNGKLLRMDR